MMKSDHWCIGLLVIQGLLDTQATWLKLGSLFQASWAKNPTFVFNLGHLT